MLHVLYTYIMSLLYFVRIYRSHKYYSNLSFPNLFFRHIFSLIIRLYMLRQKKKRKKKTTTSNSSPHSTHRPPSLMRPMPQYIFCHHPLYSMQQVQHIQRIYHTTNTKNENPSNLFPLDGYCHFIQCFRLKLVGYHLSYIIKVYIQLASPLIIYVGLQVSCIYLFQQDSSTQRFIILLSACSSIEL